MYHPSPLEEAYGMFLLETVFQVNVATNPIVMRISGRSAVPFLSQSQVHRDVLRNIWSTVDPETTGSLMNPYQFYAILRMVALAQNGLGADLETLNLNHVGMPLAVFQGYAIPDEGMLQNFYYQRKQGLTSGPPSTPNPQYPQQQPEQPAMPSDISAPQLQDSGTSTENAVQSDVPPADSLVSIEDAFGGLIEVEDALLPSLDSFAPPPVPVDETPPLPSFESIVQPTISMDSGTDMSNIGSVAASQQSREGTTLDPTSSADVLGGNDISKDTVPVLPPDLTIGNENDEDDDDDEDDFGNFSSAQPSGPEFPVAPLSDPQSLPQNSSLPPSDPGISSLAGSDPMYGASSSEGPSFPPPAPSSGNWDALDSLVDVVDAPLPSLPPPTFADPPADSNDVLGGDPEHVEGDDDDDDDDDSFGDFVEVVPETNATGGGFVHAAVESSNAEADDEVDSRAVISRNIVDDSQDESFGEFDMAQPDANQEPITNEQVLTDPPEEATLQSKSQENVASEIVGDIEEEIELPNEELALDDAWGAFDALGTVEDAPLPALQPITHADVAGIEPGYDTANPLAAVSDDLGSGDFDTNEVTVGEVPDPLPSSEVGEPIPSESSGFGDFQEPGNVDHCQPRGLEDVQEVMGTFRGGSELDSGAFGAFQEPSGPTEPADLFGGFEDFQVPTGGDTKGLPQGVGAAPPTSNAVEENEIGGFGKFEDPHERDTTFEPEESSGFSELPAPSLVQGTVEPSESDGFGEFQDPALVPTTTEPSSSDGFTDFQGPVVDPTIETSKPIAFDAFDDKVKTQVDETSGFGEFQDPVLSENIDGFGDFQDTQNLPANSTQATDEEVPNTTMNEFGDFHDPGGSGNDGQTVEPSESDEFGGFQDPSQVTRNSEPSSSEAFPNFQAPAMTSTIETSESTTFDAFGDNGRSEGDDQSGFGEFQDPPSDFQDTINLPPNREATNTTEFTNPAGYGNGGNFEDRGFEADNFQPTIVAIPPAAKETRSAAPCPLDRVDSSYYSAEQHLRTMSSNDSDDFGAFEDAVQTEEDPRNLDTISTKDVATLEVTVKQDSMVPESAVSEDFDVSRDKYTSLFLGLPTCILRTQGQELVSEFGVFYDEFTRKKTSGPDALEIHRSLHLMELLSTPRSSTSAESWKEAFAVVGEEVRRLLGILKEVGEFSTQELAAVERRLETYVIEIAEMIRVTRNITATIGDVLLLEPSTVLSAETLKSSWGSLELVHLSLALEIDWEQVEDLAVDLEVVSKDQMQEYPSLVTIRSNGANAKYSPSQERCHCTFQPLHSLHGTDLTTTTVQWQGRSFMACAANFLANRLGHVSV